MPTTTPPVPVGTVTVKIVSVWQNEGEPKQCRMEVRRNGAALGDLAGIPLEGTLVNCKPGDEFDLIPKAK